MVDFSSVTCQELQHFEIPYRFRIDRTGPPMPLDTPDLRSSHAWIWMLV